MEISPSLRQSYGLSHETVPEQALTLLIFTHFCLELLHLAKDRPQTDTAVAKRLVTRALGLKHKQQDGSGTEVLLPESLDQEE